MLVEDSRVYLCVRGSYFCHLPVYLDRTLDDQCLEYQFTEPTFNLFKKTWKKN